MHISILRTKLLVAVGAAALAVMLFATAAQGATNPGYERFSGCPQSEEISTCLLVRIKSGYFKMGNKEVPIEKEITLGGGTDEFGESFSFNSEGGLSKAPQKVPGGVVGLTGLEWLTELLTGNALNLYATTELAGTPGSPLLEPAFLPIKVHLTNPAGLLGNNCYVGSSAEPIKLNLFTTVPPEPPLHGEPSKVTILPNIHKVDNTFAAPGAHGCVLNLGLIPLNIDSVIDAASGLPSASGKNSTEQIVDVELVGSEFVY